MITVNLNLRAVDMCGCVYVCWQEWVSSHVTLDFPEFFMVQDTGEQSVCEGKDLNDIKQLQRLQFQLFWG